MIPSVYSLFVVGAILTCILTPMVRYTALKNGFLDCPQRARKVHLHATPRLGGAAILCSFLIVVLIAGLSVPELNELLIGQSPVIGSIILGSIGIFTIGFLDDLARLSPKTKLSGEFLIAGLVVWGANLSFETVQFLGLGTLSFPQWFGLDFLVCG